MKKEYIILLMILLLLTGCTKKTNNIINNKYKSVVCYKETFEDNIIGGSKIEAVFDDNKLYKVIYLDEVIFSGESLKYLANEIKYSNKFPTNENI